MNLAGAVIGEELEFLENVHFEISDGVISHIGRGKVAGSGSIEFGSGVAIPALLNSHIHPFDYAFAEVGLDLGIGELVAEPHGLKHRLLRRTPPEKLKEAVRNVAFLQISRGVLSMVSFCELGCPGALIAREATRNLPLNSIVLGRPIAEEELDRVLGISDGLGLSSPLIYDTNFMRLMKRKSGGKLVVVHISETKRTHDLGDFELGMKYLEPNVVIHGVHLDSEQLSELAERHVSLVFCPRSNMWFSVGIPPIVEAIESNVNIALGTNNAGWLNPDIWREMELTWNLIRLRGRKDVRAEEVLKMVTINAAKAFKLGNVAIKEGSEANFVVINLEAIGPAHNKIAGIVKRGSGESVVEAFFRGKPVKGFAT